MKRISVKSLVKQVAQSSDFYGKSDVTPEEFFRYKKSPFLTKALVGIKCSNELFSAITNELLSHNSITKTSTLDFNLISIESLDDIRNRKYKTYYFISAFLTFAIFSLVAYKLFDIQNNLSAGSIIGSLAAVFWFGLIAVGIIVQPIVETITDWRMSSLVLFKEAILFLKSNSADYQQGLEYWQNLTWQDFEKEVTRKFVSFGYNAINPKFSGDEGVDVVITDGDRKFIVQCKAMKGKIGPAFIRDFIGTIALQKASGGMVITLNGFSDNSLEISNYENLFLMKIQDFLLLEKDQLRKMIGW